MRKLEDALFRLDRLSRPAAEVGVRAHETNVKVIVVIREVTNHAVRFVLAARILDPPVELRLGDALFLRVR